MHALHYHFLKVQAVLLLACGRRPAALSRFEEMLSLVPVDAYALASSAHVQAQLGRRPEAITGLQQLTAAHPQNAAAWFNLAYLLQQDGRHDEAGFAFERAVAIDSRMDQAWYGLALVLIQQQRFREAAQALERNTALQPLSPYGWYRLAQVNFSLGDMDKARTVIAPLRRFEPRVAAQLEHEHGLASRQGEDKGEGATSNGRAASRVAHAAH
jgi:predicted Zn-dependent protease